MRISREPYAIERIISVASYMTAGGVGFVWLIIAAFLKKQVTHFVMYHILQSIFLSLTVYLIHILSNMLLVIIDRIPVINMIPVLLTAPISVFFDLSIVQFCSTIIVLYLSITSGLGYYSYLPWISDIVRGNTGQR